ncbi:anaerobic ribonucleoside-triphosphate reductase activating protein [Terasakiispira papahanaumokuakeensis]|uniref:Anaerobic ribonucleoside-triphosphate reductase activating protein n=2 Tax=Terasakiispira papahanaumokuakeensis TaxID=197479 RepID=A0A1E2VBM0_9GAMM|nr:anaerobic ribonucleoside-triphosphate reductase activating protein [Terasakiispira papahanaumokuakeensis]
MPSLPVAGITPLTTIDFPDRLACVVFLQGCPLRCGYCHNPQMIKPRQAAPEEWSQVEDFLQRRQGLLEGVVISGGEPTMHSGLVEALVRIKTLGFMTGLHTSGVYPRRLAEALPYLDWVGLDVKGISTPNAQCRGHVDQVTGRKGLAEAFQASLHLLTQSKVDLECRTTVHPRDFNEHSLDQLAHTLSEAEVTDWIIQAARHQQCLDADYQKPAAPLALDPWCQRWRPCFNRLELRRA